MNDLRLRAADPARDIHADPNDAQARALLAAIVAAPRGARPARHRRRLALAALATASAAVAVAVPLASHTDKPTISRAAFTVSVRSDGSARFTVHWSELRDPAALQAALDRAHVPVRILTGSLLSAPPRQRIPACSLPDHGGPYDKRGVQWDFMNPESEVNGIVVRSRYFPPAGTLVIEVYYRPGGTAFAGMVSFMAVGSVPTCVIPAVGQPAGGGPT